MTRFIRPLFVALVLFSTALHAQGPGKAAIASAHELATDAGFEILAAGGNAFKAYSLPDAVLRFKQGVGRLIRSGRDEGRIVVLDPRIRTKWYGRWFRDALPDCPWIAEDSGDDFSLRK